jgi:hypothetical protein
MDEINKLIHESLWADYDHASEFPNQTPLLAHYTSISNFDCIVDGEELWFANPLNMNDSDELIFGMNQGITEFRKSEALFKACGGEEIFSRLMGMLDKYVDSFDKNHVLDIYISCFSLHDEDDFDGSLSMWRGYGADGSGVSFVIDTKKIVPDEESSIILSSIIYSTNKERVEWIQERIAQLAELLVNFEKTDEILKSIAWNWVERLKIFSLFTKHKGFEEEREWRFVYLRDRDPEGRYLPMFGYNISNNGVEPKLKLRLDKIPSTITSLTLDSLIDRVILGPTSSSILSVRSVARMLEIKGKRDLMKKVYASSIPYRSN